MTSLKGRIQESLWNKFLINTGILPDEKGYVARIEDNLVPGVSTDLFLNDLKQGSGSELEWKFRAVHSSSALAVNVFSFWKKQPSSLPIMKEDGFDKLTFEKKCPTILGGAPPNLDVFLEKDSCVVGIESKFLEYLMPKIPAFAASYFRNTFPNAEKCWLSLLESLPVGGVQFLDTAQLVKHYLGLINNYHSRKIVLIYMFWEPKNWKNYDIFIQHRNEIENFTNSVSDSVVNFKAKSSQELWEEWAEIKSCHDHVMNLKNRYFLDIN